jgi:hypothetical protein
MAADYVEGRVLPPEGMEPWRAAIAPWVPGGVAGRSPVPDLGPVPVVDRLDLLVPRRSG